MEGRWFLSLTTRHAQISQIVSLFYIPFRFVGGEGEDGGDMILNVCISSQATGVHGTFLS